MWPIGGGVAVTNTSHSPNSPMDLAYRLLKAPPYHGTSSENAKQIMVEGLKPTVQEYLTEKGEEHAPAKAWASDDPKVAAEYAIFQPPTVYERQEAGLGPPTSHELISDTKRPSGPPTIIHIADDVPYKRLSPEGYADHHVVNYDKTIPPDKLSVEWQGVPFDENKYSNWREWSQDNNKLFDEHLKNKGSPIDIAYRLLKARQTKLYNWIQDYPGKEPVQQMSAQPSAHMRNYLEGEYPEELWSFIGDNPDDTESHGASRHRSDDEGNYLAVGVRGKSPIGELPTRGPFSNIKDGGGVRVVGKDDMPDPDDIVVIPKNASHHGNFNPKQKGQFRKPKSKPPKRFARVLDIGR